MRNVKLATGLLFAAAVLCGAAQADDTTGLTKDTIKLGVFGPVTGSAALFGKAIFGSEAVLKQVNDRGGIHGRKIEIVREDTACDPAKGIAAFKKLISQDQVFAIDGGLCSGVVMALKSEIGKSGVPFVVMGAASPAVSNPNVANLFQPVATTDVVARTMIDFAMSKPGTTKVAFVSHSDDWGKSNRDPGVEHLKSKYKIDPVVDLTMERGSNDATPQILRIRNSGAQFVVMMMYPAEAAIFVRDAYKYGLAVPILGPQSISLEDTRDRVGTPAAAENLYVFFPYVDAFDSPAMKQWGDLITKYFPSERIESFSFLGIGGTLTLVKALEQVGPDLTREKLIAALNGIQGFDTGVLAVPVSFTPTDHAGIKGGAMASFRKGKVVVMKTWQDK